MNKIDEVKIDARQQIIKSTKGVRDTEKAAISKVEQAAWKQEQSTEKEEARKAITSAIKQAQKHALSHRFGDHKEDATEKHKPKVMSFKEAANADTESDRQRVQK